MPWSSSFNRCVSVSMLLATMQIIHAVDAVVVNPDGSAKFNYPATGPFLLGTTTPYSISTTYNCAAPLPAGSSVAGRFYMLSGASAFTVTLPSASVAGAGAVLVFNVAARSSAPQQYTIAPVSPQTLDGRADLVLIHTNSLVIVSDGSNWVSLMKKVDTDWIKEPTGMTIGATVTPPTKGASTESLYWRRMGGNLEMRSRFYQTGAGQAGSGDYLWKLPNGFSMDQQKADFSTAVLQSEASPVGSGLYSGVTNVAYPGLALVYPRDVTSLRILNVNQGPGGSPQVGIVGSGWAPLSNAGIGWAWQATVPIQGW